MAGSRTRCTRRPRRCAEATAVSLRASACYHAGDHADTLEALSAGKPETFANIATASDDVALIAFTSGSTGQAKGTMHFHRDVLAICECFSAQILQPRADDVFCGTPPLGFTFALGGLVLFPFRVGASTVLIEQPSPNGPARRDPALPRHASSSPRRRCIAAWRAWSATTTSRSLREMRLGGRDAAAGHLQRLAGGDGHQTDRRHRRDGDAAHLHLRRR